MIVELTYKVPVVVTVDTEAGTVKHVGVECESVTLDTQAAIVDENGDPVPSHEAEVAVKIAEGDDGYEGIWPVWDHNY